MLPSEFFIDRNLDLPSKLRRVASRMMSCASLMKVQDRNGKIVISESSGVLDVQ